MGSSDQKGKLAPGWARHYGIGIEFVGGVAVFALAGYWADRHWQSSPWGLLVGLTLGFIGGMYNLIREANLASRQAREEDLAEKQLGESQSNTGERAP